MADVIKEYAFKISVEGNKAVIKEFKQIDSQIQKGTKTLDKQNKELTKTNSLLWTYAKRLVSIYAIYKLFNKGISLATNFVEQGNALKNMSVSANVSSKSLQKLGYLVKKYGGDEKSVASTMKNLNSNLWWLHNRGDDSAFQKYMENFGGFPMSQNAEDFLKELSDNLKHIDAEEQNAILDSLGIGDEGLRLLLREGNLEEKMKGAKVLFTDEQLDKAQKVKELMVDFNHEISKLGLILGELLLPAITEFLKEAQKFFADPKGFLLRKGKESFINTLTNNPFYKFAKAELEFMFGSTAYDDSRRKGIKALGYSETALDKMASMNYDLNRFIEGANWRNIAVYNDNAINVNGTKTPEQVAQAVAGNIIGISDSSLSLAGLGFATKHR